MARAQIISEIGAGKYTIKRLWAGRSDLQTKIDFLNVKIVELQNKYDAMPESTFDELFDKNIVKMQITSLQKRVSYLTNNMPDDNTVEAWCADFTEGLTGEVGTIDIAGEYTSDVNIRPGEIESNAYSAVRDGDLYPAVTLGPWTTLLNMMIYPGWQKFKPLHRYATIIEASIDYENHKCAVAVKPTFSLLNYNVNRAATGGGENPAAERGVKSNVVKNYNVNYGDRFGIEEIEQLTESYQITKQRTLPFYTQNAAAAHPGFLDFVERYPDHPISNVTQLRNPVTITDAKYIEIKRICTKIDYWFRYESDQSGYSVSDHWDVMYDLGDPWYWTPSYEGEPQAEFFFGLKSLEYDDSGVIIKPSDSTIEDFYQWGTYDPQNVRLEFEASQQHIIGPRPKRSGDCEDFVLTKMQAIIEAGILDASNLQILLCYVVNAGYHAVLGIQTASHGFLISDQRDYGQLWEINQLSRTHHWESFSVATAAGGGTPTAAKAQVVLTDVPIEYMNCNSAAFVEGDDVIIEFIDQDWSTPKVIGFEAIPQTCNAVYNFPGLSNPRAGEDKSQTRKLNYNSETWEWKSTFPQNDTFSDSSSRGNYAATGENGLGLTLGGYTFIDNFKWRRFFDYLDLFDSTTEIFSIGTNHPQNKSDLIFESLDNGKCISHGGLSWNYGTNPYDAGNSGTVYGEAHRYTISSDSFENAQKGDSVYGHASFNIINYLYIVGGAQNLGQFDETPYRLMRAYSNSSDTWHSATACPEVFTRVHGYNIENNGLVGGGGYAYGTGTKNTSYLYDTDAETWSQKANGFASFGLQGTGTALNKTVALQFSPGGSDQLTHWADYKLSTDTWRDRGVYGNIVGYFDGDLDRPVYGNRRYTAGAEL